MSDLIKQLRQLLDQMRQIAAEKSLLLDPMHPVYEQMKSEAQYRAWNDKKKWLGTNKPGTN